MVLSGTIGLTGDVDEKLKQLTEHFDYDSAKEMALFAFAYAVTENLSRYPVSNTETKWNFGSFSDKNDKALDFEKILTICYPHEDEKNFEKIIVELIHAGVNEIYSRYSKDQYLSLIDLL